MEYADVINDFKKAISIRYPEGINYRKKISEILGLNPRTVTNKLSGKSEFTVSEVIRLCVGLDISFNELSLFSKDDRRYPLELIYEGLDSYRNTFEYLIGVFETAAKSPDAIYMATTNTFPEIAITTYENIATYCYFKWLYYTQRPPQMPPYSQIRLTDKDYELFGRRSRALKSIPHSSYIFNIDMVKNVADELMFFYKSHLLNVEDIRKILVNLEQYTDDLERICHSGKNGEKPVEIMYSKVNMYDELVVVQSEKISFAYLFAHFYFPLVAKNPQTYAMFKNWLEGWKLSANAISLSGAAERYNFISKQRSDLQRIKNLFSK